MKIVQIIYTLSSGGAEKFVVNLSNELAAKGNDVCVCILREANESYSFNRQFLRDDVKFVSLCIPAGFSPSQIPDVERFLDEQHPDVVHCHLNVIPFIFRYALHHREIRFFHTIHNVADKACGNRYQIVFNRFFYKRNIIHPITISDVCQQSYVRLYGLDNSSMIINGTAPVKPSCSFLDVQDEVKRLKPNENTKVFIHVARFDPQKNQALLIGVFNRLYDEGENFILLVVGRGFDSYPGSELRNAACDKIFFLGEKSNVGDYLLNSDAFCLTSVFEGLPISLLEAISCGVTPICTPVGGVLDVITDGVNGYLSEKTDMDAYYAAIRRFLSNNIEKESTMTSFSKYSIDKCATAYCDVFSDALFNSVLTVGPSYRPPRGGIAQVIDSYDKFIYHPLKYIPNSCDGSLAGKVLILGSSLARFVYSLLFDRAIRIVHIHTASNNSFRRSSIFVSLAHLFGKRTILHVHGGAFAEYVDNNFGKVTSCLRKCDAIVSLSDEWKRYFENKFPFVKVFSLPNPVVPPTEDHKYRDDNLLNILFLGNVNESKGILNLVRICEEHLGELDGKVRFTIAGNDELNIRKIIGEKGLDNVMCYRGWADGELKRDLLNKAHLLILPSYFEGVPISILEAESYHLPILASNVGGIPSIVHHGENGFLFEPEDLDAIFKYILYFEERGASYEQMGEASFVIAKKHFPESVKNHLLTIYNETY